MRRNCFSLIELLIVVGILGALTTLILPIFQVGEREAKDTVAKAKMKDIQAAFGRFYSDLLGEMQKVDEEKDGTQTNFYLQDIAENGLWPLFMRNHPYKTESSETEDWVTNEFRRYPLFSQESGFGWRGPYLEQDGVKKIAKPNLVYDYSERKGKLVPSKFGGQSAGSEAAIPVLSDPYGGYYRVLCPEERTDGKGNELPLVKRLRRMVLVCTGPNKKLETKTQSFLSSTSDLFIQAYNGDDIVAVGDDMVIRLLPTAR